MIVDKVVAQKVKEFQIQEFIQESLQQLGVSGSKLHMTPLGEKVVVYAARPGLVVGRRGQSIKKLTHLLKKKFNLENPQIEIVELENPNLDAHVVAERIANSMERFGSQRFKGIGHKVMEEVMQSGALGVEILLSGKIPSARAKRWRFYQGYLKKSGDIAITGVRKAYAAAKLKSGIVGIQVRIMPPTTELPDKITFNSGLTFEAVAPEEVKASPVEEKKTSRKKNNSATKEKTEKKAASKRTKKQAEMPSPEAAPVAQPEGHVA